MDPYRTPNELKPEREKYRSDTVNVDDDMEHFLGLFISIVVLPVAFMFVLWSGWLE